MKILKAILRWLLLFVTGVICLLVIAGFIPFNRSETPINGGLIRIKHPSLWALLTGVESLSACKVTYQPKNGRQGTIVFKEFFADWPAYVFPSSDGHSLLCLYDWDTSVPLFKIDPDRPFDASQKTYIIKFTVWSSPWHIEEASLADYQEADAYLSKQPWDAGWIGADVRRSIQHIKDGEPPVPFAENESSVSH